MSTYILIILITIELLLLTDRHYVSFGEELTPVPFPASAHTDA